MSHILYVVLAVFFVVWSFFETNRGSPEVGLVLGYVLIALSLIGFIPGFVDWPKGWTT